MKQNKPVILIGSLTKENRGAIPTITKAFIEGLQNSYYFIPHYAERKYGKTKTSNFNAINVYYFLKHLIQWTYKVIIYRPNIAHYPITSYWNLEKSLIFLKVAKILGCKTIGHLHGGAFDSFWNKLSISRKRIAINLLNSLDHLIVLSAYWKGYVVKKAGMRHVTVLSNPINKHFETATKNTAISDGDNILFMGSLGRRKGVYDIIEAAARLKTDLNCQIWLAGSEDKANDMQNILSNIRAHQVKRYVHVVGPLYDNEKISAFNNANIFLFPSYNENFPLVIIEAACAGLPIITTPVGALPEFFEDNKSVIFVQPGNINEIQNAILELLRDVHKRRRLGAGAREVFLSRLSRDKIIKDLSAVYQEVLYAKSNG